LTFVLLGLDLLLETLVAILFFGHLRLVYQFLLSLIDLLQVFFDLLVRRRRLCWLDVELLGVLAGLLGPVDLL
jgi:hypothetical protein